MSAWVTVFWGVVAAALIATLFVVGDHVRDRENRLAALNRQILSEQERIQVLRNELAFLTQPQILEVQNARALGLTPIEADQLHRSSFLPARPVGALASPRAHAHAGRGGSPGLLPTEPLPRLSSNAGGGGAR